MHKKIILIAITALSIVGCRKDPTNVAPTDQLDSKTYPKTIADLQSFLIPGYSTFRGFALYGQHFLPLVLSNDHTFCSSQSGNTFGTAGGELLVNNVTPTNNPNAQLYSWLYQGVAQMNVCLERCDYYQRNFGDEAEVDPIRGQARFLRAYYLFELECFYGERFIDMTQPEDPTVLGVPLPTNFASTVAQANLPRSSAYQVWKQIITDLDSSTRQLHGVVYNTANEGRVTEWAADGLLGKVYVFTKQYDSAKTYLLKVINNGVNSLMPFSKYQNAFNGNSANEFNEESLFEINVDRMPGVPTAVFNSADILNCVTTNQGETFAPTVIAANGADGTGPGAQNMGGSYVQYFVHDMNLKRFGFEFPPYSLVPNPLSVGPSTAATPASIMDPVSWANSQNARTNKTADPRLFVCALEPWVDSVEQPAAGSAPGATAQSAPDTIPVGKAYIISKPPVSRAAYWGWSFKKFTTIDNTLGFYDFNDGANLYLLRLADVYLLYAEACIAQPDGLGTTADGLEYINKVHRRAYGVAAPFAGPTIYDYHTTSDVTSDSVTTDLLHTSPLMYERFAELFGEGGWGFDVARWGIGMNEANFYVYGTSDYDPGTNSGPPYSIINPANWSGSGSNIAAEHFPIPLVETQSNPAIQRNNYPY